MLQHIPVLLKEVIELLSPKDGGIYFDGTFGGGGYSKAILESANCKVIASDRDPNVKSIADAFTANYQKRFSFSHARFSEIKSIVSSIESVEDESNNRNKEKFNGKLDGIILDLGVSNFQLVDPERGFSFNSSGPIDMRMGLCQETALEVIRKYSENDLANIIYKFGEEHFSRRIAKNIKNNLNQINNTEDLANTIRACVRRTSKKIDPATKTFQALRIFVNKELDELEKVLQDSVDLLNPDGKIIVVSFHSLEDRLVKFFFKELASQKDRFRLLTKKPIVPSEDEIRSNYKSRSAKLRGISINGMVE